MYDESFDCMREDAIQYGIQRNRDVLERWCREAGVKTPVGYYKNSSEGVYYVYTDRPGYLIGKGGALALKYIEEIKSKFTDIHEVRFVEIKGGFANYNL